MWDLLRFLKMCLLADFCTVFDCMELLAEGNWGMDYWHDTGDGRLNCSKGSALNELAL